jgi:tetratricopeptide (TPR) repeat protein
MPHGPLSHMPARRRQAMSRYLVLAIVPAFLGLGGCGQKPAAPARPTAATSAPAAPVASDVSEAEALEFGQWLEKAIADQDAAAYSQAIDWDTLADRATKDLAVAGNPEEVKRGMMKGLMQSGNPLTQVANLVAQGGGYKLLRVHRNGDEMRALFRMLLPEAGVNYHDIPLVRGANGRVQGADLFIFITAEYLSESLRRTLLNTMPQSDPGLLDRLSGRDKAWMDGAKDFQRMTQAVKSGQPQEALRIYESLPETLKNDKMCLMIRIHAATSAGDEREHMQAFRKLRSEYPNDASLAFLSIDYHTLRKNYDEALEAVEQLDKQVQGDPYLDALRASIHVNAGNNEEALELANQSIEAEPLIAAYWVLVTVSLNKKDYDETLRLLKKMDTSFEMIWNDLGAQEEYAGFAASPQYARWQEYLATK